MQLEQWAGLLRTESATMEEVKEAAGPQWPSVLALYNGGSFNIDRK